MKLTLISVYSNGRRASKFVMAQIINGKAVVSTEIVNSMLSSIGCVARGQTYSIG